MSEPTYEVIKHIGRIATYPSGWTKELNVVSWNGGTEKYDIRDWDATHEHMSRGITLHKDEAMKLFELLQDKFAPAEMAEGEPQADIQLGEYKCCRHENPVTVEWCEANCEKYYSCDTVANADDDHKRFYEENEDQ